MGGGIQSKDFPTKYCRTGKTGWQQLQVGAFGTCIGTSRLPGSTRARSGGSNNLSGITQDGANVYRYFIDNGAKVVNYEFAVPARPAAEIRTKVKEFLVRPGNNKFLYLSGHGDKDGDLALGEADEYLQVSHVFDWLNEAEFDGHITIMVDACYSGQWAKRLIARIDEKNMGGMSRQSRNNSGYKTFINLRLSSLANEESGDTRSGGSYTLGCLEALRKEWDWTPGQTGDGWGTKVLVNRKPDDKSVLWSTSKSEDQTDIAVDFVCLNGKWTWYFPSSRDDYL